MGLESINVHRQHLNEKQGKSCREGSQGKLKRMSWEKRESSLKIMLNTMKKKKWD